MSSSELSRTDRYTAETLCNLWPFSLLLRRQTSLCSLHISSKDVKTIINHIALQIDNIHYSSVSHGMLELMYHTPPQVDKYICRDARARYGGKGSWRVLTASDVPSSHVSPLKKALLSSSPRKNQNGDKNKPKPDKKKPVPEPKPDKKKPKPDRDGGREPREPRGPNAQGVSHSP